jgi:hypothetical protein
MSVFEDHSVEMRKDVYTRGGTILYTIPYNAPWNEKSGVRTTKYHPTRVPFFFFDVGRRIDEIRNHMRLEAVFDFRGFEHRDT